MESHNKCSTVLHDKKKESFYPKQKKKIEKIHEMVIFNETAT